MREEGEKSPLAAPDQVVFTVMFVQGLFFMCAFVGLTIWSLLFTFSVTTTVSDVVQPQPYTCNVLSPRNSMLAFDATISEGSHYVTATESTKSCITSLRKASNNCDANKMSYSLLSVFGTCAPLTFSWTPPPPIPHPPTHPPTLDPPDKCTASDF